MSKDMTKLVNEVKDELRKEFKSMREALERDFRNDLREINTELKSINDGMNFMNKEFEEIKLKIQSVISENAVLKRKNAELNQKCDMIARLLKGNEQSLVQSEQYLRRYNIEVKGIPKTETENINDLVLELGNLIGEQIALSDIEACHRVPTRDTAKSNVIVQFQRREKRDSVLDKTKKKELLAKISDFLKHRLSM